MARKKRTTRRKFVRVENLKCLFCESKTTPGYKDYKVLGKFVSDRAKIIGKKRSGLCNKHQRMLTIQIKRARHLGLLPFSPSL